MNLKVVDYEFLTSKMDYRCFEINLKLKGMLIAFIKTRNQLKAKTDIPKVEIVCRKSVYLQSGINSYFSAFSYLI